MTNPELHNINGLTAAEVMQLSLDYNASPEAFEHAGIFQAIYVEDLKIFRYQLQDLDEQDEAHTERQLQYRALEKILNNKRARRRASRLGASALTGDPGETEAGHELAEPLTLSLTDSLKMLIMAKNELLDLRQATNISGDMIAEAFADYMSTQVSGRPRASINGKVYDWDNGVVTRQFRENQKDKVMIYGSSGLFHDYTEKHLARSGNRSPLIEPRMVTAKDWQKFIDDLALLTRY